MPIIVDTHAHIVQLDHPMRADRPYTPRRDATLDTYLKLLNDHRVDAGVLVQPSFYGTDNSLLVASLAQAPERLRGVAVVAADVSDVELEQLAAAGVVGIRYNLLEGDPGVLQRPEQHALVRRIAERGWHLEVQVRGAAWCEVLRALDGISVRLIADHYGRPEPRDGLACAGLAALTAEGRTGRVFVKLSAPYRNAGIDLTTVTQRLYDRLGSGRLMWGSDWPWTRFEMGRDYVTLRATTGPSNSVPLADQLAATATQLYGFGR